MLGIYIHMPFCVRKCNYCDFVSTGDHSLMDAYLRALPIEMKITSRLYSDAVDTVFLGGGTPSVLPHDAVRGILESLRRYYDIRPNAEITVECNPGTLDKEKLSEYVDSGVNRISLGMQAAQDGHLKKLGRRHTVAQFDKAFDLVREAGIRNVNVDVIYALPGQMMDEWEETLYHVLYKKPEHISAYALKIEDGTPFGQALADGEIVEADEDVDADMYALAQKLLPEKGYTNYEISNFAFAGKECAHNIKYWNLDDYLGLGAAAHSNVGRLRFANTPDIEAYIKELEAGKLHYESSQYISDKNRAFEYIMLKLRMKKGFTFTAFKTLFGHRIEKERAAGIKKAAALRLIQDSEEGIFPTPKGFALQNTLIHLLSENGDSNI